MARLGVRSRRDLVAQKSVLRFDNLGLRVRSTLASSFQGPESRLCLNHGLKIIGSTGWSSQSPAILGLPGDTNGSKPLYGVSMDKFLKIVVEMKRFIVPLAVVLAVLAVIYAVPYANLSLASHPASTSS